MGSHKQLSLWYMDTAGVMDAMPGSNVQPVNTGTKNRKIICEGGKHFEMMRHLHCDVFNQDKFLLNGVEMKVTLVRAKDAFCLMDSSAAANYKLHILEATLFVRRAKIAPGILLAHAKTLSATTAKYPLTRVEVKSFILNSGILSNTIDNVVLGPLPKRIIIGFVDNRAFNGSRLHNPFNFQHFKLNFLCLYVDGKQIPGKPLQPQFLTTGIHDAEAYQTLFSGTGIHFSDNGLQIDRYSYSLGYTLFAFDLTPDLSAHCASHWNLVKSGSLRIEIRFASPLDETVNCIVYTEYDNILEIDSTRQVIVDYSN